MYWNWKSCESVYMMPLKGTRKKTTKKPTKNQTKVVKQKAPTKRKRKPPKPKTPLDAKKLKCDTDTCPKREWQR